MIFPDSLLSEHSATIEKALAKAAAKIGPKEFGGLIGDAGMSVIRSGMDCLKADSMSIWLANLDQTHLVVTHSEPDRDFIGYEQPITEGLISLAFASEQCLCENQVYLNADHSKKADKAMSQITCALIAAPFYIAGELRGVISCVQLKDSVDDPDPPGFTARNMNRIRRLSTVMERLVNYRLLTTLLDLEI